MLRHLGQAVIWHWMEGPEAVSKFVVEKVSIMGLSQTKQGVMSGHLSKENPTCDIKSVFSSQVIEKAVVSVLTKCPLLRCSAQGGLIYIEWKACI